MAIKAICQREDTANDGNVWHYQHPSEHTKHKSEHGALFCGTVHDSPTTIEQSPHSSPRFFTIQFQLSLQSYFFTSHRLLNHQESAPKGPLKNQPSSAPTRKKLLLLKCLAPLHKFPPQNIYHLLLWTVSLDSYHLLSSYYISKFCNRLLHLFHLTKIATLE